MLTGMLTRRLIQMRRRGQSWTCTFKHPLTGKAVYANLGKSAQTAEHNLEKLNAIFLNEANWHVLPPDTPPEVRRMWSSMRKVSIDKSRPTEKAQAGEAFAIAEADELRNMVEQQKEIIERREAELEDLRGGKYRRLTSPLAECLLKFTPTFDLPHLNKEYRRCFLWRLDRFVEKFGGTTPLGKMAGREKEIRAWVANMESSPGASNQWRTALCRFLEESGLKVDRRAFGPFANPPKPILWLDADQATALGEFLTPYARDLWQVQVDTLLRPTELATIKSNDVSAANGKSLLTLSTLDHLRLKQGSRTIPLSYRATMVLNRRFKENTIAFPNGEGKPWTSQRWFCMEYHRMLQEGKRAAEAELKITLPPIDSRTGRRTGASLLLRKGYSLEQVATLLGDDIRTVRRHYARLLPQEINL